MSSELEVIDAFVDGQRVDASTLKDALATSEGRDYLVDTWLLREVVQADNGASGDPASNRLLPRPVPGRSPRSWLVAAAIGGSLIGGYALGQRTPSLLPQPSSPPQQTASAEVRPASAFPVPAPTRVIQVEFETADRNRGGN